MELNRREFLALTGSAVAIRLDARADAGGRDAPVSVWHFEGDCCALESLAGYRRALAAVDARFATVSEATAARSARTLNDEAYRGATVLIESGLVSNVLLTELGVDAGALLNLWRREFSPAIPIPPYINYAWPIAVKVRDFSHVVPLSAPGWQSIAHVDGVCVGLARRTGRGRIVLLGSPLGPVLRAGDREAHEWLAAVIELRARTGSARRFLQTAPAPRETAGARSRA